MIEDISKKQEKIQEKVQKQQDLNDKNCRELTDEELDQIVGGAPHAVVTVMQAAKTLHGEQVTMPEAQMPEAAREIAR